MNIQRLLAPLFLVAVLSAVVTSYGQSFPAVIESEELDGADGFALHGGHLAGLAGETGQGTDLNGDGINDILVAAPDASPESIDGGELYVLYGSQDGFPAVVQLVQIDQGGGLIVRGYPEDFEFTGESLAGVGDVNGDGFGDFLFGVPRSDRPGTFADYGQVYLLYGRPDLTGFFRLEDFNGEQGVIFDGALADDRAGTEVAALGDVNGDGLADFGIGGTAYDGKTFVVFGSVSFPDVVNLGTMGGAEGFAFYGEQVSEGAFRVADTGDLNHDGLDDVAIGAYDADVDGLVDAGQTYVVFGRKSYPKSPILPSDLDGTTGFVIAGSEEMAAAGQVHGIRDFNGDGVDDLVIGARLADPNGIVDAGSAYVVFGSESGFPPRLNLDEIDGENGFVIFSEEQGANLGWDTAGAGDVNGDGLRDVVVGAREANPEGFSSTGAAYVVFGKKNDPTPAISVESLDGINGFTLLGPASGSSTGDSVASAGDVNGDGLDDILVGNAFADDNGLNTGAAYVVYGRSLLELEVTAEACPGPAEIQIKGATPNSQIAIVSGTGLGTSPVSGDVCPGLDLNLESPRLLRQLVSDADGNGVLAGNLPMGACGGWLQVVDRTACRKSAVRALPEQ